jgi:hypothetical protein
VDGAHPARLTQGFRSESRRQGGRLCTHLGPGKAWQVPFVARVFVDGVRGQQGVREEFSTVYVVVAVTFQGVRGKGEAPTLRSHSAPLDSQSEKHLADSFRSHYHMRIGPSASKGHSRTQAQSPISSLSTEAFSKARLQSHGCNNCLMLCL